MHTNPRLHATPIARRVFATALFFCMLSGGLGPFGCALLQSSGSVGDLVSSPFESSSKLSGGDDTAYRRDVESFTIAFVEGRELGGNAGAEAALPSFQRGLSALAEERGITNWEEDPLTCASIGSGLGEAGLSLDEVRSFGRALFAHHGAARSAIERGYHDGFGSTL